MEDREWWLNRITQISAMQVAWQCVNILLVGRDYRIQRSTDEVNRIFGYVPEELDGQELDIIIPEESRLQHRKVFEKYIEDPVDRTMGSGMMQHIFDGRHKSGEKIKVSISLRVRSVEGKKIAIAKIFPVIEVK